MSYETEFMKEFEWIRPKSWSMKWLSKKAEGFVKTRMKRAKICHDSLWKPFGHYLTQGKVWKFHAGRVSRLPDGLSGEKILKPALQ